MFKKTIIIILSFLALTLSTINLVASDPPAYEDMILLYSEILNEDLENYEYTVYEYGDDYILVEIEGVTYVVQK